MVFDGTSAEAAIPDHIRISRLARENELLRTGAVEIRKLIDSCPGCSEKLAVLEFLVGKGGSSTTEEIQAFLDRRADLTQNPPRGSLERSK